ncbi:hypothetical protein LPB86_11645 [Pedobacter sp. MC2016-14]|uniref:hypothetical protein n=1 Tax=Pedobacter sp. MC2016-14 TaxID=2897327 RepID=UPI001E3DB4EF|nr:hypothetical protein [Pedobacter sp. MC2016-14]MCD0488885.1 hypothetical protein [Pedobacter sp. MC2016-14]
MQTQVHKILTGVVLLAITTVISTFAQTTQTYPKLAGYVGIAHPIVTFSSDGTHTNFKDSYTIGMPIGINIWKSARIGFSSEIVPTIKATNSSSKVSNVLFHPGILVALGSGFTFAGRAAFETSGRYGLTPVINKIVKKNKGCSYFVAIPLPARFGNDQPSSFGIGFQFGIAF